MGEGCHQKGIIQKLMERLRMEKHVSLPQH